ncbi:TPA: hypothetical protein L3M66_004495 [Vibrio parahaemolyticus]|uniref:putative adhesin n=1 Tax=Vibrio parahaemolyticus TaxID=670 RepID=UPI00111E71EE|nr:hypothetical protein [Vibrio parahaemolyticus]TOG38632.1 hypothetical protein CGJ02_23885 [Vibrio parahaemolyticus]HBN6205848.1 hypothetical protein [Vibrio parahaemolyticus]
MTKNWDHPEAQESDGSLMTHRSPLTLAGPGLTSVMEALSLSQTNDSQVLHPLFLHLQQAYLTQAQEFRALGYNCFLPTFDFALRDEFEQQVQRLEQDIASPFGKNCHDINRLTIQLRRQVECFTPTQVNAWITEQVAGQAKEDKSHDTKSDGSRRAAQSLVRRLEAGLKVMSVLAQTLSDMVLNDDQVTFDAHLRRELVRELAHDYHAAPAQFTQASSVHAPYYDDAGRGATPLTSDVTMANAVLSSEQALSDELTRIEAQPSNDESQRLWLQIRDERTVEALERREALQSKALKDIQQEINKIDDKLKGKGVTVPHYDKVHLQPSRSLPFKGGALAYLGVTELLLSDALKTVQASHVETLKALKQHQEKRRQYTPAERPSPHPLSKEAAKQALNKATSKVTSTVAKGLRKALGVIQVVTSPDELQQELNKSLRRKGEQLAVTGDKLFLVANKVQGKGKVTHRVLNENLSWEDERQRLCDAMVARVLSHLQQPIILIEQTAHSLVTDSNALDKVTHEPKDRAEKEAAWQARLKEVKQRLTLLKTTEREDSPQDVQAAMKQALQEQAEALLHRLVAELDLPIEAQTAVEQRSQDMLMAKEKRVFHRLSLAQYQVLQWFAEMQKEALLPVRDEKTLTHLAQKIRTLSDKLALETGHHLVRGKESSGPVSERVREQDTQRLSDSIVRSVLWQLQQPAADLQQAAQPLLTTSKALSDFNMEEGMLPVEFSSEPSSLFELLQRKHRLESPENKAAMKKKTLDELLIKNVTQLSQAIETFETHERKDSPQDVKAAFRQKFDHDAKALVDALVSPLELRPEERQAIKLRCDAVLSPLLPRLSESLFDCLATLENAVTEGQSPSRLMNKVKESVERGVLHCALMKARLAERSAHETGRDLDEMSRGARLAKHWAMILVEKMVAGQALPSPGEVLVLLRRYGLNDQVHSAGDPEGALMATRLSKELARAQAGTLLPPMTPERYAAHEKDWLEFMVTWGQRRFTRGFAEHIFESALSVPTTFTFNIFSPLYRLPLASLRIPYKVYKTKSLTMPGSDKPYKAIDTMVKKRMQQLGFHMLTSPMPTVMKTALGGVLAGAGYVYNKHVSGKEQTLDGIYEQMVNGKQSQQLRMDSVGALAVRSVSALSSSGFEVLSDHVQRQVLTLSTPIEPQLSDLLDGLQDDEAFEGTMSDLEWAVDAIEQNGEQGPPVEYIDAQAVSSNSLDELWPFEMEDETSTSRRVRRSLGDDDSPRAAEPYRPQRLLPHIQQRNVPMPRQPLEDYLHSGSADEQTEKQEINDAYQLKGLTSAQRRQVVDVDDSIYEPFNWTESDQHRMDAFKWLLTEKWAGKGADLPRGQYHWDIKKVRSAPRRVEGQIIRPTRVGGGFMAHDGNRLHNVTHASPRIVLFGQEWAYQEYDKPSTRERIYKIGLPDGSKFVQVVPQNGTFKLVVADDMWEYNRQKALKDLNLDGYPESLKTLIKSEMRHIERGANPRNFREYQLRLYRMLSLLSQVNADTPQWDLSAYEGAGLPDGVRNTVRAAVKLKQVFVNLAGSHPNIREQLRSIEELPNSDLTPIRTALHKLGINLDDEMVRVTLDAEGEQECQRLMMHPRIRNEVHQYYRAFIDKVKSDVFAQLVPYLVNSEEKLNALNLSREQRTQISEELAEFNASVARSPEEAFSMYNRATREWEGQLERVALGIHGNPVEQVVAAYKRRKLALFVDHHYSGIGGDHFEVGYQYYSDLETHFYLDHLPTRSLVFDEQLADLKALWPSDVQRDRESVNRVLTKLTTYNNKLQVSAAPRRVKEGMNSVCSSLRFHAKVMEHAPHLLREPEYEQVMENLRVSLERWRHDRDVNEDDVKAIEPSLQEVVFRLSGGLSLNRTVELPRSGMSHRTLATYFSLQTGFSQPSIAKWLERSIVLKTPDGQVQFQPLHAYLRAGHPLQVLHYKGLLNNPDEEPLSDDVIRKLDASLADYRFNLERNSGRLSEYDKALSGFNQRLNVALPRYVSVSLLRDGQSQELVLMPTALFLSGAMDNANAHWPPSLDTAQMRSLDETYDKALEQMKVSLFDAHKHETKVLKEEYGEELFRQALPIDGTQSSVCFHALLSGRLPNHLVERVCKPDSLSALQWEAIVSGQAYQEILKAADELEALETRTRDLLAKGEQALETLQTPAQFTEGLFARYHINANDTFTVTARKVVPDNIKHNRDELAKFRRRYPDQSFEVNYLDYVRGVDETHLETDRWAGHTLDFEVPQPLRRLVLENRNIESVYQTYLNTQLNEEASQGVNLIYRLIDKSQFSDVETLKDNLNNAMDLFYLNEHEAVGLQLLTSVQQIYAVVDIALPINPLVNLALDLIFEYGFSKWKQALATEEFGEAFNQEANINLVYSLVIGGMQLSPKAQKVIHRLQASSSIDTSSISSAGSQALQSLKGQASALYRRVFPVNEVFPERVAKIRHNNLDGADVARAIDDVDGGALVDDVASDTSAFTTTERPFQLMGKAMLGRKTRQGKFSVSWNNGETWQAGNKVSLFAWTLQNAGGRVRLAQRLDGVSHRSVDVQDVLLHQRAGGGSTDNAGPSIRAVEGEGRPMNGGNPPLRRPLLGEEVWKGSSQVLPGSDQDFVLYLDAGGQPEAFFDTLTEVAPRLSAKRFSYFGKTLEGKVESGGFWVKSNEVGAQWVQGSWLQQATWRFKYRQGKVSDVQELDENINRASRKDAMYSSICYTAAFNDAQQAGTLSPQAVKWLHRDVAKPDAAKEIMNSAHYKQAFGFNSKTAKQALDMSELTQSGFIHINEFVGEERHFRHVIYVHVSTEGTFFYQVNSSQLQVKLGTWEPLGKHASVNHSKHRMDRDTVAAFNDYLTTENKGYVFTSIDEVQRQYIATQTRIDELEQGFEVTVGGRRRGAEHMDILSDGKVIGRTPLSKERDDTGKGPALLSQYTDQFKGKAGQQAISIMADEQGFFYHKGMEAASPEWIKHTPEQFVEYIKEYGGVDLREGSGPIHLLACYAKSSGAAQALADTTGRPVVAYSNREVSWRPASTIESPSLEVLTPAGQLRRWLTRQNFKRASARVFSPRNSEVFDVASGEGGLPLRKNDIAEALTERSHNAQELEVIEHSHGLVEDIFQKYQANPLEKCEQSAKELHSFLKTQHGYTEVRFGNIAFWEGASGMDADMFTNHWVVLANYNGVEVVFDPTAHQFSTKYGINEPILETRHNWTARYQQALNEKRGVLAKMVEVSHVSGAPFSSSEQFSGFRYIQGARVLSSSHWYSQSGYNLYAKSLKGSVRQAFVTNEPSTSFVLGTANGHMGPEKPKLVQYVNDADDVRYKGDYESYLSGLTEDMAASERQKLPSLLDKLARKQRSMREYRESSGAPSVVFQQSERLAQTNLAQLEAEFPHLKPTKEEIGASFVLIKGKGEPPAKRLIISAHGDFDPGMSGGVMVPPGKKVVFLGKHGDTLSEVPPEGSTLGWDKLLNGHYKPYATVTRGEGVDYHGRDISPSDATGLDEIRRPERVRKYRIKYFEKTSEGEYEAAVWHNRKPSSDATPADILTVKPEASWQEFSSLLDKMKPGMELAQYDEIVFCACREPIGGGGRGPASDVEFES